MDRQKAEIFQRAFGLSGQVAILTGAATGLVRAAPSRTARLAINPLPGAEALAEKVR